MRNVIYHIYRVFDIYRYSISVEFHQAHAKFKKYRYVLEKF